MSFLSSTFHLISTLFQIGGTINLSYIFFEDLHEEVNIHAYFVPFFKETFSGTLYTLF